MFIDSADPGGAETLVVELANAYIDAGHAVEIWCFGNAWLERAAKQRELSIRILDDRLYRRFYKLPIFAIQFAKLLRQAHVDVVHSHLYGAVVGAAPACLLGGVRHVGTLHDVYSLSESRSRIAGLHAAGVMGTRIVSVSKDIERFLVGRSAAMSKYVCTIHNGIEPGRLAEGDGRWDAGRTEFICVARLVAVKQIGNLLKAGTLLTDYDFRISIIGDGPDREALEAMAARTVTGNKIRFLGFRDDVEAQLLKSHCFVLPSRSEGLSCSIMEAMAAGLPVISTDVGGNPELIDNGRTGWLVPRQDVDALARCMRDAIESREQLAAAGEAAREKLLTEFSADAMVNSYLRIMEMP